MSANVAVVGATGAVGEQMLSILESRKFPVRDLRLFASPRSEGKTLSFRGKTSKVEKLSSGCFKGVDIVFFDASDEISAEWVPQAQAAGAWVVDNSAAYRMKDVPLVVPEINGDLIATQKKTRLIAGPNCSTAQLVLALAPLAKNWGLKRVVVSSYQSVSGAGRAAIDELRDQLREDLQRGPTELTGSKVKPKSFAHPIAFECLPQIGRFVDQGQTSEEQKIEKETRKILNLPDLRITATCVRVPTLQSHAESVNAELQKSFNLEDVKAALSEQRGIEVQDAPASSTYPLVRASAGKDPVYVGRLRVDSSVPHGVNLWVVADNLRKGAALNAIQIGERILELRGE